MRSEDKVIECTILQCLLRDCVIQIIERVKAVSGQTKLTVVDPDADKWFQEQTISMMYGLPEQLITRCWAQNADNRNRKSGDNGDLDNGIV